MSARWWSLAELVEAFPNEIVINTTLLGDGSWSATATGRFDGQDAILVVSFGAMASQFWGAAARLSLVRDRGSLGALDLYSTQLRFVVPSEEFGYADTPFGTFAFNNSGFDSPLSLVPSPQTAQNPIPDGAAAMAAVLTNLSIRTNGDASPRLDLNIEFFGDFALGTFWTDLVNARAGA